MTGLFRQVFFFLTLCCILFSLSCVKNGTPVSGGGIDIGNPAKVCVVDPLDKPVFNASVKVISPDDWFANVVRGKSAVSDSASTDKAGIASFDSIAHGFYNVQVDHDSGGALARNIFLAESQAVAIVRIKQYGAISGAVSSDSDKPLQIHLTGTAYSAPIASNGTYIMTHIPEGICISVVMAADSLWTLGRTVSVASRQTTGIEDEVSFNSLLIDDFEDSASTKKLSRLVMGGMIYSAQSGHNGTSAEFQIVPEGAVGKNALKGTLIRNGAWVLVGFMLGNKPGADSLWDFHLATGLSFYAKGSGKLNVSFESDSIDKMGFFKHYSHNIVLEPEWRYVIIPFDSLTFYNDANPDPPITWEESARSIKRIEFNALEGDTVKFWLDDFTVNGVDFSKVY